MTTLLRTRIKRLFPVLDQMPYYSALEAGEFDMEQTMKAHLQDLARSIGCRGLREIQLAKLNNETNPHGPVTPQDAAVLRATIEEELSINGKPSHFDVRLQMFDSLGLSVSVLESVTPLEEAATATRRFRQIFTDRTLVDITAAVGSIELWYIPVAARLEELYLDLGYSPHQVATYTLHREADQEHSAVALEFAERYSSSADYERILEAVRVGFQTVILYDEARLRAAIDPSRNFEHYLGAAT